MSTTLIFANIQINASANSPLRADELYLLHVLAVTENPNWHGQCCERCNYFVSSRTIEWNSSGYSETSCSLLHSLGTSHFVIFKLMALLIGRKWEKNSLYSLIRFFLLHCNKIKFVIFSFSSNAPINKDTPSWNIRLI